VPAIELGPLVQGSVVSRANRFAVLVEVGGRQVKAYLPNSGRLEELLAPGTPAWLAYRPGPTRTTQYDLVLVRVGGTYVSVDARLPHRFLALALGELPGFAEWRLLEREPRRGRGRFDLLLGRGRERMYVECKSVTLVRSGTGLFPDAPTARGARHLAELTRALREGYWSRVVFVVGRSDVAEVRPNDETDPAFGRALREAASAGVEVMALALRVDPERIEFDRCIPVRLR